MHISPHYVLLLASEGKIRKTDLERFWLDDTGYYMPEILPEPATFELLPTISHVPILNYTTKVGVTATVTQLTALLAKHGCREITTRFEVGKPSALIFLIDYKDHVLRFKLPTNPVDVLQKLKTTKGIPEKYRNFEHAERVSWRIVKDWVEAQIAVIESGQAETAEVFLPYAIDKEGATLFQNLQQGALPQLKQ